MKDLIRFISKVFVCLVASLISIQASARIDFDLRRGNSPPFSEINFGYMVSENRVDRPVFLVVDRNQVFGATSNEVSDQKPFATLEQIRRQSEDRYFDYKMYLQVRPGTREILDSLTLYFQGYESQKGRQLRPIMMTAATKDIPLSAGRIQKIIPVGTALVLLTDQNQMFVVYIKGSFRAAELVLDQVKVPLRTAQEMINQEVAGMVIQSYRRIVVGLNGSPMGLKFGSKLVAFDGKDGAKTASSLFLHQIVKLDLEQSYRSSDFLLKVRFYSDLRPDPRRYGFSSETYTLGLKGVE